MITGIVSPAPAVVLLGGLVASGLCDPAAARNAAGTATIVSVASP